MHLKAIFSNIFTSFCRKKIWSRAEFDRFIHMPTAVNTQFCEDCQDKNVTLYGSIWKKLSYQIVLRLNQFNCGCLTVLNMFVRLHKNIVWPLCSICWCNNMGNFFQNGGNIIGNGRKAISVGKSSSKNDSAPRSNEHSNYFGINSYNPYATENGM